jgi:hypothetical protein
VYGHNTGWLLSDEGCLIKLIHESKVLEDGHCCKIIRSVTYSDCLRAERPKGQGSSPSMVKEFSFLHIVQTSSEVHPTSYPMGTESSFPGGKAVRVWSWPLTFS